jgi:CelD/BcsL family acetyltransferase involved in cellulose biosynthesis
VFTAFHRELVERLVPRGLMRLCRVNSRGTTLGCAQLLIDRGRVLLYQGGRITGDSRHSPGLVTDFLAMRESLARGYSAFDFMAGDSMHKQRLTTHTQDLVWAVQRRPRLKFAVMDQLRQIKRWVATLQQGGA